MSSPSLLTWRESVRLLARMSVYCIEFVKFIKSIMFVKLFAKGDGIADVAGGAQERAIGERVLPPFVVDLVL